MREKSLAEASERNPPKRQRERNPKRRRGIPPSAGGESPKRRRGIPQAPEGNPPPNEIPHRLCARLRLPSPLFAQPTVIPSVKLRCFKKVSVLHPNLILTLEGDSVQNGPYHEHEASPVKFCARFVFHLFPPWHRAPPQASAVSVLHPKIQDFVLFCHLLSLHTWVQASSVFQPALRASSPPSLYNPPLFKRSSFKG